MTSISLWVRKQFNCSVYTKTFVPFVFVIFEYNRKTFISVTSRSTRKPPLVYQPRCLLNKPTCFFFFFFFDNSFSFKIHRITDKRISFNNIDSSRRSAIVFYLFFLIIFQFNFFFMKYEIFI